MWVIITCNRPIYMENKLSKSVQFISIHFLDILIHELLLKRPHLCMVLFFSSYGKTFHNTTFHDTLYPFCNQPGFNLLRPKIVSVGRRVAAYVGPAKSGDVKFGNCLYANLLHFYHFYCYHKSLLCVSGFVNLLILSRTWKFTTI